MGNLYEGRMGYHGNIQLKTSGWGGGGRREEVGEEREGDRKLNYVACSA